MTLKTLHTFYAVVRSITGSDSRVRLQSDPIIRGLRREVDTPACVVAPEAAKDIREGACVLFHYNDIAAVKTVKQLVARRHDLTIVCLCSDIHSFGWYLDVRDVVDLYITPTDLHRRVLMSQLGRPVYTVPESVDPITGIPPAGPRGFPVKHGKRILWFGYPESFEKAMASLVPVLLVNVESQRIESFNLIVGMQDFHNKFRLTTIPFSTETFADHAQRFDYCVLSHFALDLALNSYIKSPNKLVTALMTGLIPIASRTPSYENLLSDFGLQRFLYDSPSDLDRILKALDPVADSALVRDSGIVEGIMERFSEANVARIFLQVLSDFHQLSAEEKPDIRPETVAPKRPELRLSEHVVDLVPSALRAVKWRLRSAGLARRWTRNA
jgi:hypothetical protein